MKSLVLVVFQLTHSQYLNRSIFLSSFHFESKSIYD